MHIHELTLDIANDIFPYSSVEVVVVPERLSPNAWASLIPLPVQSRIIVLELFSNRVQRNGALSI